MEIACSSGDIQRSHEQECLPYTAKILALQLCKISCMDLGDIVAALMDANGWNAPELARQVTVIRKKKTSRQNIEDVVFKRALRPRYLMELAKAFGKSAEDLVAWRPGMPTFGPNVPKPKQLTVEGSDDEASPELQVIRLRNAIKSLRFAVGAMATVLASTRPDEAEAVADLFEGQVDPDYADMGMGAEFLASIRAAVHAARARPSTQRGKAG